MTRRVVVIGAGMSGIECVALAALLDAQMVNAVAECRKSLDMVPTELSAAGIKPLLALAPPPKFGERAYLKKKKGRP